LLGEAPSNCAIESFLSIVTGADRAAMITT